jgi:hypothetical protein
MIVTNDVGCIQDDRRGDRIDTDIIVIDSVLTLVGRM